MLWFLTTEVLACHRWIPGKAYFLLGRKSRSTGRSGCLLVSAPLRCWFWCGCVNVLLSPIPSASRSAPADAFHINWEGRNGEAWSLHHFSYCLNSFLFWPFQHWASCDFYCPLSLDVIFSIHSLFRIINISVSTVPLHQDQVLHKCRWGWGERGRGQGGSSLVGDSCSVKTCWDKLL